MPFGAGHRHCPGVGMGMMLIKCFLAKLVGEFEWAPAAQDCSGGVDVTELNGFLKLMKKPLSGRFLLPKSFTSGDMAFSSGRKGL
jgi:cytochrome P450